MSNPFGGPPGGGAYYPYGNSALRTAPGVTDQQMAQLQAEVEQELYLRRQIKLQQDIELRRQLAIEEQQANQLIQLAQAPLTSSLLQQQRLLDLQQQLNPHTGASSLLGFGGDDLLSQALRQEIIAQQQHQQQQQQQQQLQAQVQAQIEAQAAQSQAKAQAQAEAQAAQARAEEAQAQAAQVRAQNQAEANENTRQLALQQVEQRLAQAQQQIGLERDIPQMSKLDGTLNAAPPLAPAEESTKSAKKKTKKRKTSEALDSPSEAEKRKKKTESDKNELKTGVSNLLDIIQVPEPPTETILALDKEDSILPRPKDLSMLLSATKDPTVKDFDHYREELAMDGTSTEPDLATLTKEVRALAEEHDIDTSDPNFAVKLIEKLRAVSSASLVDDPEPKESPKGFKRYAAVESLPELPEEEEYDELEEEPIVVRYEEDNDDMSPEKSNTSAPATEKDDTEGSEANSPDKKIPDTDDKKKKKRRKGQRGKGKKSKEIQISAVKPPVLHGPQYLSVEENVKNPIIFNASSVDTWWPSNSAIRRERRSDKSDKGDEEEDRPDPNKGGLAKNSIKTVKAIRTRLENDAEPGVLQKLPHCKLHRSSTRKESKNGQIRYTEPMFCFQVTEKHCTDVMLCCSICSTWRHAQCGGHYTKYSPKDSSNPDKPFRPICDRCYEDIKLIKDYPQAQGRISKQRNEHLRRTLASASILRQACFSKHGGQYRWPLGHVAPTHVDSHMRSVKIRHERAERQWCDAVSKLGTGAHASRKKDNTKIRTKEFERMLGFVEDAEASTDLHNMTLFLQRDSTRETPAGFENPHSNFFDPETPDGILKGSSSDCDNADKTKVPSTLTTQQVGKVAPKYNGHNEDTLQNESTEVKTESSICSRKDCERKRRYDSLFCSDGCGISVVEADLLKSLELASNLHPSVLTRNTQYT